MVKKIPIFNARWSLDPDEYVSIKARYNKQKKDIKDKIANFKASKQELIDLKKWAAFTREHTGNLRYRKRSS